MRVYSGNGELVRLLLAIPRTADLHQHLGIPSKLIMPSELSSDPGRKFQIGSFTRSCSASRPNFIGSLSNALAQLVVYLACLRQSRVNRGRSNTSIYGVATDGLSYIFVTITHEGVLKESGLFNVMDGNLSTVLECLQYILETAMSMFPSETPEWEGLKKSDELQADGDDLIDLDDSPYLDSDDE